MLKHGTQATSTFLLFDVFYCGIPGNPPRRKRKRETVRGEWLLAERNPWVWARGFFRGGGDGAKIAMDETQRKATKKTMNNRSQKPRVCEELEHGAYAKDSRIEVDDGRHEELGRREMVSFLFFSFYLSGMGHVTAANERGERHSSVKGRAAEQIIGRGRTPRYFTVCYF
jgi:hypothetical protein